MNVLRKRHWSPYLAGALIGVLSWLTFVTADKPIGVSTTFVRLTGFAEKAVASEYVEENAYLKSKKVKVDWQMMLVLGIFLGALLSAKLSGAYVTEKVPVLWARRFGERPWVRYLFAFLGGVILLFGARLAGGCTSGHGLSGGMQLAVSGWVFFISLFAAGVATAYCLFGKETKHV